MSFSGKKFRRIRCDNVRDMMRSDIDPRIVTYLMSSAPVFSYIRLDEKTFIFRLMLENRVMSHRFRLGEEFEMKRHNGTKIRMIYTLEGEDVLNQVIKHPNGQVTYFRREFGATTRMIVTSQKMRRPAVIYYEQVN